MDIVYCARKCALDVQLVWYQQWLEESLTGVQQQLHYGEVGVRDGVVQSCVSIAVGHVDDELKELRGNGGERVHVGLHHRSVSSFMTGDPEPLLQDAGVGCPLKTRNTQTVSFTNWHPKKKKTAYVLSIRTCMA